MKKLESTKIRILLCSIIVSSVAADHASPHHGVPHHGGTSPPRKKSQSSAVPAGIQLPEKVMSTRDVSCISADSNILEIMKEAKKSCRGNDMICTFYLFSNQKYYNIGSLNINKELFDKLLMKYDNWLLTAEKIAAKDTVFLNRGDEKHRERVEELDTLNKSDRLASTDTDKYNSDIKNGEAINIDSNKEHISHHKNHKRIHANAENEVTHINLKEKNGKFIELLPKYDDEHKYFEVFLPEDEELGKPRTINVKINYENDNELKEDAMFDTNDAFYKNRRVGNKFDPLSTNIHEYDTKYLNENTYLNQGDLDSIDTTLSNKIKPKSLQETNSFLGQPQIQINKTDILNTYIANDTLIVDTNMGDISSGDAQERLSQNINIDSSNQDIYLSNSNFKIIDDTALNKDLPVDASITANNKDRDHEKNNTLIQNIDNIRTLNDNSETLVLNDREPTNIISPDIKEDINENMHLNTEHSDEPENAHEKHNLTPSPNKTKHMHDLVDQATLNDDYHPHPLEYTNIYNEVDFDDTHLSIHDNDTQLSSHIHLNEPVFVAVDSSRKNHLETSPFVVAVPKFGPTYQTISDFVGTQIDITPPKNKSDVSDSSAKPITSLPISYSVVPEPIVLDVNTTNNTAPNLIKPSQIICPEVVASSTNALLNSDLGSSSAIHDAPGSKLSTIAFAPIESIIKPHLASEISPILESAEVCSDNEISLDGNSLSLTEANSDMHQNETTICTDESSITNDLNILESPLPISPDDTPSEIKLDVLPTSNWHIENPTNLASRKSNVNFQQEPHTILSESTKSSKSDLEFIPETPFFDMASPKPIENPSKLENPYFVQPYTKSLTPNQFQTSSSKSVTESEIKPLSLSETSPHLDEKISDSFEPISSESITPLEPENKLLELGISPLISHDQPLPVNEVLQPQIPSLTDTVLSDVDLHNHLTTKELNDLTKNEQQLDEVPKPLLATGPFSSAESSNILLDIPSQHKTIIGVSSPIPSSNYSPSVQSEMIDQLIPHSGIPLPKQASPLPNKDFVALPSVKPPFSTNLQPSIHNNDNVLTALNNFAKSTKMNPLNDEDYQRLIKELPPDLTNYFLSAGTDSQVKLPILDSLKPVNKIFNQKTEPAVDQYTSIGEIPPTRVELLNLPSTLVTGSKLETISPSILSETPLHIKPIAIEQPSNLQQDSSLRPLLATELTNFKEESSSFQQPSLLAEYTQTTPVPTDSFSFASKSLPEAVSSIKDFSVVTEASAPSPPLDSKKVVLEIEPITVQPDWSTYVASNLGAASASQLDTVSPKTLPVPVFEPTPSFESPLTQYERLVPSLTFDSKSPQFYEESETALKNVILETLTSDTTKKSIPFIEYKLLQTPKHTKIIPPTLSLVPEDSTFSTYIPATSTLANTLSPLSNVPETHHISQQYSSETILKDLRPVDQLTNQHIGPKPVVSNQLEISLPISSVPSVSTTFESIIPQDYKQKHITPHYATTIPYINTDVNQLLLTPLMQSDISSSATLSNIHPQDTQKFVSQETLQLQSPFILPSASISHNDHINSYPSSSFASTALDADFTLTPNYESSLEYIPQLNVLEHPSKPIPWLPSQFYTPLTYASSDFNKTKDIILQNSFLLTPNSFAHPSLHTQLPFSPSLLSEVSQPSMYAEYELKKELPSIKVEASANISPLEFANLQKSNLFTQVSLEDNFKQIDTPCQKVIQTPLTLPDQSHESLTVVEPSIYRPCIEPSFTFNSNTVPLQPTNTFVNEDFSKNIQGTPYTPVPLSPYVPTKPISRPNWQIPLITKNVQASEPVLCIDSQVANADFSSIPIKAAQDNMICKNRPGSEILNLDSYIPVENISPSSQFTPSHSSMIEPLQYIPETTKFKIQPNLVLSKYKPICLNDNRPVMDENISQLLKDMSNMPLTQTSKASILAAQERPVCERDILSPFESIISASVPSTASKPNRIDTRPLKDSEISLIPNYIPLINMPQKPTPLQKTALQMAIPQNVLSESLLPVDSFLPFEDVSTVLSHPCSFKSEIPVISKPFDANLLPNALPPLEYKPIISETEFSKNIPPQFISDVVETPPQDYSISFEKISNPKLTPIQPVLPIQMPCPTSTPPIYLNPPYSSNYPHKTRYKLQQPIDLKLLKDSPKFSTIPVCSRPIGTEFLQPIEESFSMVSSKSPPTISYNDINFAKLKPQLVSKPAISVPMQSPSYSTPILLSQSDILPTSTICSQTPQVKTPQYTLTSSNFKPLELQNIKPMKPQYQIIPNILEYIELITKPKLDTKSQVSSIPCLPFVTKVPSSPLDVLPAAPIVPEFSAPSPCLPSPIWIKPSYTKSILSSSPLQPCPSSLAPVCVKPTPEYITPILPTIQMSPLTPVSSLLSSTYAKHAPQVNNPISPIQPESNKLFSGYAMPYTSQIVPSTPLKVHPITPLQISAKPVSSVNTIPVSPALPSPSDFTSFSPSYTLLPYSSPSVYFKPKPPPCKLYEAPSNLYLSKHITPASCVEAVPCIPSFIGKLPVSPQPPIYQQSIPAASPVSQHFIPTTMSSPISPTFTKVPAPAYTTPILSSPSSAQGYMKPLSQKQMESLLSEYIAPLSPSHYLPSPSPSKPSYIRPCSSSVSYIDNLLQMDLNSQAKKPLAKSQKLPFNIPSYDKQKFVNEIQYIPMISNVNPIKSLSTYRPTSISSSISNLQINQNNLGKNVIEAVIAPPAETTVIQTVTSGNQQSTSDTNIWTDAIEVTKELNKESKPVTYVESLSNISELDEMTKLLLDNILSQGGLMPSLSVSSVSNIPVSETIIHKKSGLIPSNILKLEESKEILLNEDLLQGDYRPYPAIRSLPTEPKMEGILSEGPYLAPLQCYSPLLPPTVAPQSISIQTPPTLSTSILPLKPCSKSPAIPFQFASYMNPLPETGYSLIKQHPCNVLPLQKQPQPSLLSLPYSLIPATELSQIPEQSVPEYASKSSDVKPIIDNMIYSQETPQARRIPTVSHTSVPLKSYTMPYSKLATPISPIEPCETYANIPYSSPMYIKPSPIIPWKQVLPTQPSPTPIHKYEAPIITNSDIQGSSLPKTKTKVQPLTPVEDLNYIILSNEAPAIPAVIDSQNNVTPTEMSSSFTTLTELENSLISPVYIKPSTTLDAIPISQSNNLFPLGNAPKYSNPIETIPYYTSSRPCSSFHPSDLKQNTQSSKNQFKIPLITPLSYPQSEEAADLYATIRPHPKLISKGSKEQLNAPVSLPLTYTEAEFTESYEPSKRHPKLLAALDQSAISPTTIADSTSILSTMTPLDIIPETYIPNLPQYRPTILPITSSSLLKPLMETKLKSRPDIFYEIPEVVPQSSLSPLGTVEAPVEKISSYAAEICTADQFYSSALLKNFKNTKESPIMLTEIPSDYVEYAPQVPLSVLDAQVKTVNGPSKVPLLKSQLLKPLLSSSHNPPNFSQFLEITPPKQSPIMSNYEYFTPLQNIESLLTESPNIIDSSTVTPMPNILPNSASTNKYELITESNVVETPSPPNTLQNSPPISKYQSLVSMLPCDSQDTQHKSQSSLLNGATIYSTASPSSLTKYLPLTTADADFPKSATSQYVSPLVYNPLESFTSINSPTNEYQSSNSMLPCDSQDIPHKRQSSPSINSPIMSTYSIVTPSLIKPLSLTSAEAEFLKSSIHSPLVRMLYDSSELKPLESYNTLAPRWKSGLPASNTSQGKLIAPVPNTTNIVPNQYPSYSQYKLLESLPTPEAHTMEIANYEEVTPSTWSSIPTPSLTPSSSVYYTDISVMNESNQTASELKSSLPVTSTLLQPKEILQIPLGYTDTSVLVTSTPSLIPIKAKGIDNTEYTEIISPLTPMSTSPISQGLISQSSSQVLPSPNILQYLPLSTNIEIQSVKPLINRQTPLQLINWDQSPIISKSSQFSETPFYQEILPQAENLQIDQNKLIPSNIVNTKIEKLKETTHLQDDLKYSLIEEPIELNLAKPIETVTPITLKGSNIKYETINPIEKAPYLTEILQDIPKSKTVITTRPQPSEKIGPKAEVSYEKYVDCQNIEPYNIKINKMAEIPQFSPSNNFYTYSPYISCTAEVPKTHKALISDTKAAHITPITINPESITEYTNLYPNNQIGNAPNLFSIPIPTKSSNNYKALPVNSETLTKICNDITSNTIEYLDSGPKLEALALNEFKTINPIDTAVPIYNQENILTPCSKSSPKIKFSSSPMEICQTPIEYTEIPCQTTSFMPDSEVKYQGYKTYYPSSKTSTKIPCPLPPLQYQNQILREIPLQAELELDNIYQGIKLDDYEHIQGVDDNKKVDKDLKSILINYINSKKDCKNNLYNKDAELTIPLGDLAINKKEPSDFETVKTNNPSIGLKVWKSNAKIVTAELKLKFKKLSVNNFMPVVNNLNEFDLEEIRKIVKNYIDEKYGNHIEIHEPYRVDNQYVVLKDFDQNAFDNKFNLLWPAEYV